MTRLRKLLLSSALLLVVLLGLFFLVVPVELEKRMNRVLGAQPLLPEAARELHTRLRVADLHADSLLWNRDLLTRGARGHVDVPRLLEGSVALQAFTVVTKVPWGLNIEQNDDRSDQITWLTLAQRWPPRTWRSLKERALYQAAKLRRAAERSDGKLTLITTAEELRNYLARRKDNPALTAGFLGIEGAHALDGDLASLDTLFDAGIRMMAPTHFFDNDVAGSAHGVEKGGLTGMGRRWVRRMEAKNMIIDLAHASPQTLDDVLAIVTRPVVVSHTGVRGACDNRRNLSDRHVKAIAETGGLIGIGFWETAVCGTDARAIARAIRYATDLVGVEHVGLGSDFDGAVTTPFDAAGLAQLTGALLAEGFSESDIRLLMGENILRVIQQLLP